MVVKRHILQIHPQENSSQIVSCEYWHRVYQTQLRCSYWATETELYSIYFQAQINQFTLSLKFDKHQHSQQ